MPCRISPISPGAQTREISFHPQFAARNGESDIPALIDHRHGSNAERTLFRRFRNRPENKAVIRRMTDQTRQIPRRDCKKLLTSIDISKCSHKIHATGLNKPACQVNCRTLGRRRYFSVELAGQAPEHTLQRGLQPSAQVPLRTAGPNTPRKPDRPGIRCSDRTFRTHCPWAASKPGT